MVRANSSKFRLHVDSMKFHAQNEDRKSIRIEAKQTHYRTGRTLRIAESWGSQISWQSADEGGKVVSPTHRPPLPPLNIPGTHSCWRLSRPQGHNTGGRIMSMNNSNDTVGNRIRELPARSAMPQPNAPSHTSCIRIIICLFPPQYFLYITCNEMHW